LTTKTYFFNEDGFKKLEFGFDPYRKDRPNTLFYYWWDMIEFENSNPDFELWKFQKELINYFNERYNKNAEYASAYYVGTQEQRQKESY